MVKNPDMLVLDGALAPLGEGRARQVLALLIDEFKERTLIAVLPNDRDLDGFDAVVRFRGAQAEFEDRRAAVVAADETAHDWTRGSNKEKRVVAGGVT
jgi:putative ABC transport system ATP-binding protein